MLPFIQSSNAQTAPLKTYVVLLAGRSVGSGYWVQADSADEARRLVALNIPGMGMARDPDFAECRADQTYAAGYGTILQASNRSYTITRRSHHATLAVVAPSGMNDNADV